MKKIKLSILTLISIALVMSFLPTVVPQVGTYTFHGAPGNIKIFKVDIVNNASLEDLFGPGWVNVIEIFEPGAAVVGARKKSLVTCVNFSDSFTFFGTWDVTTYNTSNWDWTTGTFSATPDSIGDIVTSFYDPTNLTTFVNTFYTIFPPNLPLNISMHTAGAYMAQLPTPVAQYLGALVWEPKWGSVGNTVVHDAEAGDQAFYWGFDYFEDCTEIWTYDTTYGAWIGYQILDNESNIIYKFSIELEIPGIPGFELSIFLGITGITSIGMIYVVMKKKK